MTCRFKSEHGWLKILTTRSMDPQADLWKVKSKWTIFLTLVQIVGKSVGNIVDQAQNVKVCEISDDVIAKLKKFRFRKEKNIAALLLKVDPEKMTVILDEEYEDTNIEELQEELPEHLPRFLIVSYVKDHGDGRVSYPLCFIYICPNGCKPELSMMYAGTRNLLQNELNVTKAFELRSTEDFTDEWLNEKLNFFR